MADSLSTESDEFLRKIFNYSNDAILVIDPSHDRILDVNPKACGLLGYSREELLSIPISAVHPKEMPLLLAFAESVFKQGHGWTNEFTCLTKTGQHLPAEISASFIEVAGRRCLVALVRDISERKRAEEALKQYSENLERMVEERTAELRRAEERQRLLLEINNAIIANLDRPSLFHAIAEALKKVFSLDAAAICLRDAERNIFRLFALETPSLPGYPFEVGKAFDQRDSHIGWVLENRKPLLKRDLERERQFPLEDSLLALGIRSYIVVPLISNRGVFGTLNVASMTSNAYSEEDTAFLEEIAAQISLAIENTEAYEEISRLKAQLEQENFYLQEEIKTAHNFEDIVGRCRPIKAVLKAVENVAPTDAAVLILGETGTGKELIARGVHNLSSRKSRPLVKVNCAALPAGLIESELFGHEKGAFTGALARKIGRFELGDRGTILLDEIGDLPTELQAKLLRVLQEGEFERVGGTQTIKVDVRVIAATNRDLENAVEEGRFRQDLYYRLSVFPIRVPTLRERKEDIPLLVKYFAMNYSAKLGKKIETIPQKSMNALVAYSWPGNIRELQNVIERAVITSPGVELELGNWLPRAPFAPRGQQMMTLEDLERRHIIEVLELTGWRVSGEKGAAKLLGLKPTTLEGRMKRLGIRRIPN